MDRPVRSDRSRLLVRTDCVGLGLQPYLLWNHPVLANFLAHPGKTAMAKPFEPQGFCWTICEAVLHSVTPHSLQIESSCNQQHEHIEISSTQLPYSRKLGSWLWQPWLQMHQPLGMVLW